LNLNYTLYITFVLGLLQFACTNNKTAPLKPRTGNWEIEFSFAELHIPIKLSITDTTWKIHNASETIELDSLVWNANKFYVKMPLFNTSMSGELIGDSLITGQWTDHSRDSIYTIPFTIKPLKSNYQTSTSTAPVHLVYDATFSPNSEEDKSKALGIFDINGNRITGTFLTETGDYRFLEGYATDQSISLGCFDGTHLFYFCANIAGDSLKEGKFHSGKHWTEEWCGALNPNAKLRDPDSLTFIKNDNNELKFRVRSLNGDSVIFDKNAFVGRVSIVQIFGSWCPNCTDESRFLKEIYAQYGSQGLQIIPVAFERGSDFESAKHSVTRQFHELGLSYPPYFGGISNKGAASHVFSDLSKVLSFPTTVFIDKQGKVRKIHTGFYGPGTGEYYMRHTEMLHMFVKQLINE
jgi:thiol-disulfide isomerase/thioredoxin